MEGRGEPFCSLPIEIGGPKGRELTFRMYAVRSGDLGQSGSASDNRTRFRLDPFSSLAHFQDYRRRSVVRNRRSRRISLGRRSLSVGALARTLELRLGVLRLIGIDALRLGRSEV